MIGPLRFLLGCRRLRISRAAAGEVMNLCQSYGYVYRSFEFCEEYACVECRPMTAHRLAEACRVRGIAVEEEAVRGLPGLISRYRHRYGVLVGLVLFAAIVFFSGRVIWDIRVDGNDRLDDAAVIEALREQGLHVGVLHASLDVDALENRVLLYSDEISWISVNVIGTVANVEVREVEPIPEAPPDYAAANLVAARGGVIEWFEDIRGNVAVAIGDAVAEGDLLIGGLYGKEGKSARYTCARGKVMARTERRFSVEIPLRFEEKVYTGRVFEEKYLIFFEKEVKFFGNSGNSPLSCDTIEMVEYFHTRGGSRLPVGIRTVRHCEYEWRSSERTAEQAMTLAYEGLRAQMDREIPDAMLTRKRLYGEQSDTAYVLYATIECIEDIARVEEIKIKGISD